MKNNIAIQDIANAITDRPVGMRIGNKQLYLHPPTLGKTMIVTSILNNLGMDMRIMKRMPQVELLRVAIDKKDECCKLIAYHTLNRKNDILNIEKVNKRAEYIADNMEAKDIAIAMTIILLSDNYNNIIKQTGIDKEHQRMSKVQKVKKDKNTFFFGGKTAYGSLISTACEKYHWTYDYVVWGISYTNLRLMLADSITTIYLTDEERKRVHVPNKASENIKADDPKNYEKILAMKFD